MIKISRSPVPPAILVDSKKGGVKEKNAAIIFYSDKNNSNKKFSQFKVYRNREVKRFLIDVFKGKCAYCESKFKYVYIGDIEHFRPKGAIINVIPPGSRRLNRFIHKVGYYWLAADWNNLLLSCQLCNQQQTHSIPGVEGTLVLGKKNQFPLRDEQFRIKKYNQKKEKEDIEKEDRYRLIIDPCKDDPEEFFKYDEQTGFIQPKHFRGVKKKMAEISIQVYALQRMELVHARREHILIVKSQIKRVEEKINMLNKCIYPADLEQRILKMKYRQEVKQELDYLSSFLSASQILARRRFIAFSLF